MRNLELTRTGEHLKVLCIGAHSDDIEIGCGGTLLTWIASGLKLDVHWCVLSAAGARADEASRSANAFLQDAWRARIWLAEFKDGFFPYLGGDLKQYFETLKAEIGSPDVVLTHRRRDAHQDHREVCALTWNTFRDHLILEYEIPKWDGDISTPNIYQPLSLEVLERKIELLLRHFGTQRSKDWFDRETFAGLARLRGMECRAQERFAEAFHVSKATIGISTRPNP